MHLLRADSEPPHLLKDLVGGLRPLEGFGLSLWVSTYWRMASRSCGTLVCDPRWRALAVSNPKKRSTRFSHDASVGVKCRWKRGWRSSQRCTAGALWVERLSSTTWISRVGATLASMS